MDLIFYTSASAGGCKELLRRIREEISGGRVRICRNIGKLRRLLLRPFYEVLAVVLRLVDTEELRELIRLRELLEGFWIILILPDSPGEMSSLAHCLRPRLLVYADEGGTRVGAVLSKMMQRVSTEGAGWRTVES